MPRALSSLYIQVDINLETDPTFIAFASALRDVLPERLQGAWREVALSSLVRVWSRFSERCPSGNQSEVTRDTIEEWARWNGVRGSFATAFLAHWVSQDEPQRLLRWDEVLSNKPDTPSKEAARKRVIRAHNAQLCRDMSPDKSGNVPDKSGNVPDKSANVPDKSANVPDKSANVPDKSANVPDKSGNVPDKSGNVPDKSGNVPDKSANVPDKSGISARTRALSLVTADLKAVSVKAVSRSTTEIANNNSNSNSDIGGANKGDASTTKIAVVAAADEPPLSLLQQAVQLAIAANKGSSEAMGSIQEPIVAQRASSQEAAEILEQSGVPLAFAARTIYDMARARKDPVTSLKYFTKGVIDRWHADEAIRAANNAEAPAAFVRVPSTASRELRDRDGNVVDPLMAGTAMRYARSGEPEWIEFCQLNDIAYLEDVA